LRSNILSALSEKTVEVIISNTDTLIISFSVNIEFEVDGAVSKYTSDTRYRQKKDAKKNAAYLACCGLGLIRLVELKSYAKRYSGFI